VPSIEELLRRAAADEDTMVVYVNDNHENWHSQRDELVERALAGRHPELVEPLKPPHDVPFLAKGRHSIFYETSIAHLLHVNDVHRVVLSGQVTEQCIAYSAYDAYLRGYEVHVPKDAVAHIVEEWAKASLAMMEKNLHADLTTVADGALE
jgi:nicotinamidase-related amidase